MILRKRYRIRSAFLLLEMICLNKVLLHGSQKKPHSPTIEATILPVLPTPPVPRQPAVVERSFNSFRGLSPAALLTSVRLLVESRSVELLVEQLDGIPPTMAIDFLKELISQPHAMDADEITQVAYGLTMTFAHDASNQAAAFKVLDLIDVAPALRNRPPLLVIAAHSSFPGIVPLLLSWARERGKSTQYMEDALMFIAKSLDEPMLERLQAYGVTLTPTQATLMLWHTIQTPYEPKYANRSDEYSSRRTLIEFLIQKGANVNYQRNGYTLLIKSAEHNDVQALELLIKAGARVNDIVNNEIGSALQMAVAKGNLDAELILRHYHARE